MPANPGRFQFPIVTNTDIEQIVVDLQNVIGPICEIKNKLLEYARRMRMNGYPKLTNRDLAKYGYITHRRRLEEIDERLQQMIPNLTLTPSQRNKVSRMLSVINRFRDSRHCGPVKTLDAIFQYKPTNNVGGRQSPPRSSNSRPRSQTNSRPPPRSSNSRSRSNSRPPPRPRPSAEKKQYFENGMTQNELRKAFKSLALELHPNKGGNPEQFKMMKSEYNNRRK